LTVPPEQGLRPEEGSPSFPGKDPIGGPQGGPGPQVETPAASLVAEERELVAQDHDLEVLVGLGLVVKSEELKASLEY
jgi:hypothetical protein